MVHLVIDGLRNAWTDELFFKEAKPDGFVKPKATISDEQKRLMIAELQRMNTPAALELLKTLE